MYLELIHWDRSTLSLSKLADPHMDFFFFLDFATGYTVETGNYGLITY